MGLRAPPLQLSSGNLSANGPAAGAHPSHPHDTRLGRQSSNERHFFALPDVNKLPHVFPAGANNPGSGLSKPRLSQGSSGKKSGSRSSGQHLPVLTSSYIRNARYKPGVNPLQVKEVGLAGAAGGEGGGKAGQELPQL